MISVFRIKENMNLLEKMIKAIDLPPEKYTSHPAYNFKEFMEPLEACVCICVRSVCVVCVWYMCMCVVCVWAIYGVCVVYVCV